MKGSVLLKAASAAATFVGVVSATGGICARKKVIIDTDFYNFSDDPNAIGIANAFMTWGEIEVLGVISDIRSRYAPPAIDAINTFYGHPDIPLAINPLYTEYPAYVDQLSQRFPEDTNDGENTTDPVTLYRTLLSKAPDNSVTIAAIGFFDALYLLVDSKPDAISPLTGLELIKRKVTELVVQAAGTGTSYNIVRHNPLYPTHVLNQWPTKLTFVPGFIGSSVRWGSRLTTEVDLQKNPVAWAFNTTIGYNKTHQSWDPTAMYYAVRGLDDVYVYNKTGGSVFFMPNGTAIWRDNVTAAAPQNWVNLKISNVTFAERLEGILLWQPGSVINPAQTPCTGGNSTKPGSGASGGNATVTGGRPTPTGAVSSGSKRTMNIRGLTVAVVVGGIVGMFLYT
ncbi:hypothetical protein C7212DRAFT_347851 [Tuber magnatum]|uniref:Inosine/uridine-preferring nucleoside hydrolase domain-containing protein n=1 Tax=Tuber magnatum TaxID=42249 RepID=A0A317SHC6_9PEZI|nr:hypothetical protein C7212DRAFT_347851 [Tuber magnatum]